MPLTYSVKTSQRSPLLVEAQHGADEIQANFTDTVRRGLTERGAVLLRGFPIRSAENFSDTLTTLGLAPWDDYLFREKERDVVRNKVFTTNNATKLQTHGGLHSENCYSPERPRWLAFFCQEAPTSGGETLICDAVAVCSQLSGRLRKKFKAVSRDCDYIVQKKDYQKVFGTTDSATIRSTCVRAGCGVEQTEGAAASTRLTFSHPYVIEHPETHAESLLININIWSPLGPIEVWQHFRDRHSLTSWLAVHANYLYSYLFWTGFRYAYATFHIAGNRVREIHLTAAELHELGGAMADQLTAFPWQAGDILLIDNLQMYHCGLPWQGTRSLRVMMGNFAD